MESSSRLHDVDYNSLSSVETNKYHTNILSITPTKKTTTAPFREFRFRSTVPISDYGGPIPIRSRFRSRSIYEALNRFAFPIPIYVPEFRSQVPVPSSDSDLRSQVTDYGGPIPSFRSRSIYRSVYKPF